MSAQRVLVVGGDGAGMSAAHQALRAAGGHGRELSVTVLEATGRTSYSACGLPYWVAGEVASGDDLIARSPERHREMGVDVRTGARATGLDLSTRTVTWTDGSTEHREEYDDLVVATGAHAAAPAWARDDNGALLPGVQPMRTIDDGAWWVSQTTRAGVRRAVVAGGGYIGVEMAEALLARGLEVTLVTRSRVMSGFETTMSERVEVALTDAGVTVVTGATIDGLEHDAEGALAAVNAGERRIPADVVVLALGTRPATGWLADSGLPLSARGALRPDATGRVADGVWAAGDCCEVRHRITGDWSFQPLGTHANKLGRVVGDNIGGGTLSFPGALGSAITRFAAGASYVEVARTGIALAEARDRGWDAVELTTEGTTASGYHPEAAPIAISLVAARDSGRLLGGQIVGGRGAGKRIDTVAMALWAEQTAHDLAWADLSYAPPFATAWEIVSIAARRLAERL